MKNNTNKTLRGWQTRSYENLQAARRDGKDKFLAVAGVGSGKTFFSAYVFAEFKRQGQFESVVIISPSENIKRNWSITFQRDFDLKIDHGYTFQYSWPRDCQGISITFQSLNKKNIQKLKRYISTKVLLIIDEVHHAGDNNVWGDAIQEIGEKAGFILLLSGTPTRGDNNPIPFVRYKKIDEQNKRHELQHDFYYGYAESIKDGVCCPTIFQRNFSQAETIQGYKKLDSFKEENDEIRRLYNDIITVKEQGNCYVYLTFEKANKKLNEINDKRNANHAGLIVCNSKADAKALYHRIFTTYGEDFVELVTSDDKKASKKIEQFKTSHIPWIISINMISEGVDIPRIRCIVYASNVTTEVRFQQVMGRGVRNPKHRLNNNDECYMYIPDYKPLIDNARAIEKEIKHVWQELEKKNKEPREGGWGSRDLSPEYNVLSATSEDGGNVFRGSLFDVNQDMFATIQAKKYNVSKGIYLQIWKSLLEQEGLPSTPEEKPEKLETITDEKERYKTLIQKMVGKINYDHKIDFPNIHYQLNRKIGLPTSNVATLEQLKKKLKLAQQIYEQLNEKKGNE